MQPVTIKCFTDSGCSAYLIGCRATGQALLVDPKAGKQATYLQAARDFGLRIVAVLDTHTHADHLSGSSGLAKDGVELWMSADSRCARPHRRLEDGESVKVGELAFRVIAVPGHTDDSIALFGHGLVVTGDSLLVGGLARADFRGSDPARLFDSVAKKLASLPDETIVFAGHNYRDLLFSTIGHEKRHNPDLQFAGGAEFARHVAVVEGAGNSPDVDAILALNLEADPKLPDSGAPVAACCAAGPSVPSGPRPVEQTPEELAPQRTRFTESSNWFDVRDPHEYRAAHIPGAQSYPLSELGFHLRELARKDPVVLSCRSGVRSMTAAKTLRYLGVLDQPINMTGGILRWTELRLPVESGAAR
ncbi:MAG: MBL fold metallo-hydrolase [Planctomycetota bacterium]